MKEQFKLDFFSAPEDFSACESESSSGFDLSRGRVRQLLSRAVVRWLYENDAPTGFGLGANTRISRFKADVAAFWSESMRNPHEEGPTQILRPQRTMIVECFVDRDQCWPDCTRAAELVPQLEASKREKTRLEQLIKKREPELRDGNVLFEEYAEWRYEDSENRDYHKVQREIIKLERALLRGTAFEQICSAEVADQLLLAVPAGTVDAREMADGWGLLWVHDDLSVTLEKQPEMRDCIPANRLHLVQNIAAAASRDALFNAGVSVRGDDSVVLVQPPRGHRRPKKFNLRH